MSLKTEIKIAAAQELGTKYDEASKEVFSSPEILAPVLQAVVEEYKDYSVEEIISFIDRNSIQSDPVDSVSTMADQLVSMPTEMHSLGEKLVRFDEHFVGINPKLTTQKIKIYLHMDFEVQNDYKPSSPSYPIIKRGIFYGAREISLQLGVLTEETDYAAVEKVYSIWVCNDNIPKKLQNTVSSYSITKKDLIGVTEEPEQDYDLMTVVIIRRGGEDDTSKTQQLFDYLEGVFTSDIERINKYVDIRNNQQVLKGVKNMSGLGQSIAEKALSQGIAQGLSQGLSQGRVEGGNAKIYELVQKGRLTMKEGAEELDISVEQLKSNMLNMGYRFPEE